MNKFAIPDGTYYWSVPHKDDSLTISLSHENVIPEYRRDFTTISICHNVTHNAMMAEFEGVIYIWESHMKRMLGNPIK